MDVKKIVLTPKTRRVRFTIFTAIILSLLLFISVCVNQTEDINQGAPVDVFTAHLDQRIPAMMKDYDIPGVNIALIQKGKMIWSKAYGYADMDEQRIMTTETYCRVESISKPVTAWGVLKLAENGIIDLDKPVQNYIQYWKFPESEFAEEKISVRQLLSHSSGMPLGNFLDRYSPRDAIPTLGESLTQEAVLEQEPGLSFVYSDTGFNLLELLIQEVTDHDFAEYMEEEILMPLGLNRSSFDWSEDFDPVVPTGYDLKGNAVPVYVYPKRASGGLFASVEDIAAFVIAGMPSFSRTGERVLHTETISQLYTPMVDIPGFYGLAFDSYGLGYFIETLPNGMQAVSHGGQGCGWMTHFHAVPETGDGIVIITNSQRSWPFFAFLLNDWAKWSGLNSVGFGKIIGAQKVVWTLVGVVGLLVLWYVWTLGPGIIIGIRPFAPLSKIDRVSRMVQGSISIVIGASLFWCVNQDYLFLSSVFPIASTWLGYVMLLFAGVLILSALFPRTHKT